jgi:hypothetical protein
METAPLVNIKMWRKVSIRLIVRKSARLLRETAVGTLLVVWADIFNFFFELVEFAVFSGILRGRMKAGRGQDEGRTETGLRQD